MRWLSYPGRVNAVRWLSRPRLISVRRPERPDNSSDRMLTRCTDSRRSTQVESHTEQVANMAEVRHFTLGGGQRHDPAVERWLSMVPGELGAMASRWFDQMRSCGPDVLELLHDGQATACVGNLPFGYVAAFRSQVNVGFYFGSVLDDPDCLLTGSGRFMRHVKVQPGAVSEENALEALVAAAYADAKARAAAGFKQRAAPAELRGADTEALSGAHLNRRGNPRHKA